MGLCVEASSPITGGVGQVYCLFFAMLVALEMFVFCRFCDTDHSLAVSIERVNGLILFLHSLIYGYAFEDFIAQFCC